MSRFFVWNGVWNDDAIFAFADRKFRSFLISGATLQIIFRATLIFDIDAIYTTKNETNGIDKTENRW